MPYIKQDRRAILNPPIQTLGILIRNEGELNYVITRLIDNRYGADNFDGLNTAMGILSCVIQEFYRKRIVPYEDTKAKENGEVFI